MLFLRCSGTLCWYSKKSRIDQKIHTFRRRLEKVPYHKGSQFSVYSGEWNNSRRKKGGQSTSSCLSDSVESFWKGSGRGEASFRLHGSSKKLHLKPNGVLGKIESSARSSVELWRTKSFAIMTYFAIPGDCIDRVTAQDGERVLFERLATPRPARKVTLKRNWQGQQQQQQ